MDEKLLGHYQIVGPLGAGGMGQVFRARDTRLKREVAIKMLPDDVAQDPERLARLRREAELLAACNHPNIAAIYGLEEVEGSPFLVLELVQGQTLLERLSSRPFGLDEALSVARQIASALETAHEQGIVHRDLKPANVMVDDAGHIKVLDFGLAKPFVPPADASSFPSETSTIAAPLTAEGSVVGTAPYMSPEQLRGEAIDRRTDIWALGCLLFELLSGRRAFQKRTGAETVAAILESEPDWTVLPEHTPPAIRRLLVRCLRKDLARRIHHAADARIEIEEAPVGEKELAPNRGREKLAWLVATIAIMAAAIVAVLPGGPPEATSPARFSVPLPPRVSIFPGEVQTHLAVSPDGTHLAFAADGSLWLHRFEDGASRRLSGTEGATLPFWSPDSQVIGFFSGGTIKKMPVEGGPARVICRSNQEAGIRWGSNGIVLFSQTSGGPPAIFAVSADGGEPRAVSRVGDDEVAHFWPEPLPGDRFLYLALTRGEEGIRRELRAGSLAGGEAKPVGRIDSRVQYVPPGFLLYVIDGVLVAHRFDAEGLEFLGEPIAVAERLRYFLPTGLAEFSASRDSRLPIVATHGGPWISDLVSFDRAGHRVGSRDENKAFGQLRFSPSGDRLVVDVMDPSNGARDLWIYDRPDGAPRRLTLSPADDTEGVFSPDGTYIAFRSDARGPPDIYVRAADGSGETSVVLSRPSPIQPEDWSSKGELLFQELSRKSGGDLWSLPLAEEDPVPRPLLDTPYVEWGGRFSPDGDWIGFVSDESGRSEVYIAPVEDPGARRLVSREGGVSPRWRQDGKEIYFLSSGPRRSVVAVSLDPSGSRPGPAEALFRLEEPVYAAAWDVSPDGQRFVVNVVRENSRREPIRVVVNWTALLED